MVLPSSDQLIRLTASSESRSFFYRCLSHHKLNRLRIPYPVAPPLRPPSVGTYAQIDLLPAPEAFGTVQSVAGARAEGGHPVSANVRVAPLSTEKVSGQE